MTNPAIIVPYRNREDHKEIFIPAMRAYLPDADIIIVEQADDKPFNRGKLINCGVVEYPDYPYYVFHDIDKIPIEVDYSYPTRPTQLEVSDIQTNEYFGGVTMFNNFDFNYVNGFSNDFWGWGGEDNEMYRNTIRLKLITNRPSVFQSLPHKKSGNFNMAAWLQAQKPRKKGEGLATCKYDLISKEQKEGYTLIKVML